MEHHDQREKEAEEAIASINKRTGRNMPQAIATAAALVVVILACLLIRIDLFVVLIVVFMMLALWELRVDFATAGLHIPVVTLWLCSAATLLATYYSPHHIMTLALCIMGMLLLVALSATMKLSLGNRLSLAVADKLSHTDAGARLESSFNHERGEHNHSRLSHVAVSLFTVLYIPLLAGCLIIPLTFGGHPVAHAIMLVFLPALSDTAGAWLGKHKLSPRISPKKSVEGLVGSMLFAMVGAFAVFACTYDGATWATRWWVPIVMGVMVGLVGTFGDLCASMLKRDIGIKDMGHLLKGHGGVMDRVDSILISAPFIAILLWAAGL